MNGTYGLLDSARSGTEIAKRWLGIDLASTVIGLTGVGGDAFDTYLHNRNLALDYGKLYDQKEDDLGIAKANVDIVDPVEFPDRSFAVLRNTEFLGSINSFQLDNHDKSEIRAGAYFDFDALSGGFGGVEFLMDEVYDASANQIVIQYSVQDNPGDLKIEIKDDADQIVFSKVVLLSDQSNAREVQKLVIALPNNTSLSDVKKVGVIIDQNLSGDNKGEFLIHSMNFQHLASSQEVGPDASLGAGDVTTLPNNPEGQLFSSSVNSTLDRVSSSLSKLNFDVTGNGFAGVSINFDPASSGATADLSSFTSLVFGLDSDKAKRTKIEIQDDAGNQAVFYATDIDTTRQYYSLLTSLLVGSVDLTKVKNINFVVDQDAVASGDEVGFLNIEFDGLLFP
jgi:Arc/MetJ family transcription regulator